MLVLDADQWVASGARLVRGIGPETPSHWVVGRLAMAVGCFRRASELYALAKEKR